MSKKILDYTLIIMDIMVSCLLGFDAVRSYVRKNSNTNLVDIQGQCLIDIELSMKALENKINIMLQKLEEDPEE